MARLADFLAVAAKASALSEKPRRAVAELHAKPDVQAAAELLEETRKVRQLVAEAHRRAGDSIKVMQFALVRHRRGGGSRSTCLGGRSRAPRGKPVRRRGSRRVTAPTRAGPDSDPGEPSEHRPVPAGCPA